MGFVKDLVGYGKSVERDRQRLVMQAKQEEAGWLVAIAILLAALLIGGLMFLDKRDRLDRWQEQSGMQERSKRIGMRLMMSKEERI